MNLAIRAALLSLLGLAVHASAENRVCIGGDLDHLTNSQKSACWANAADVRKSAARFHAPEDWHFFVVCTDEDWKVYAAFSKRAAAHLALEGADTDLQSRTTFLRGTWLRHSDSPGLERIVAREVASAVWQSTDEVVIQKQVALWFPQTRDQVLTLRASNDPH
jgi:hypothetical protein